MTEKKKPAPSAKQAVATQRMSKDELQELLKQAAAADPENADAQDADGDDDDAKKAPPKPAPPKKAPAKKRRPSSTSARARAGRSGGRRATRRPLRAAR
jgi:hypothetical protein